MISNVQRRNMMNRSTAVPPSKFEKGKVLLGNLVIKASTGATSFITDGSTETGGQWYFNPTFSTYMGGSTPVQQISYFYDRWRCRSVALEYNTLLGTNTNYTITWCLCKEPDHWEKVGVTNATTTPTKAEICMMKNAETFPSWVPRKVLGIRPSPQKFYTAGSEMNAYGYSDSVATARQTIAATAGIRVDGAIPGTDTIVGDIHLIYEIEFSEMNAQYSHRVEVVGPYAYASEKKSRFETYLRDQFLKFNLEEKGDTKSDTLSAYDDKFVDVERVPLRGDTLRGVQQRLNFIHDNERTRPGTPVAKRSSSNKSDK